jgi:hypothetical protein
MRIALISVVALTAAIGLPLVAAAQPDEQTATTSTSTTKSSKPEAPDQAPNAARPAPSKVLSNVQIELTISDQTGSGPVEKKIVSMIAASGTWGKIRAAGVARPNAATGNVPVGLNVDARPFVMAEGIVQVELTVGYNPLSPQSLEAYDPQTTGRAGMPPSQVRPTELNQSLTVVLQNGKPLIVSQAADPVSDRKIIVEVKATVLK